MDRQRRKRRKGEKGVSMETLQQQSIIIKQCKISYKNLDKATLFSRNEFSILSEKLKILTSSNCHKVEYSLLKFCPRFLVTNFCKEGVRDFF